KRYHLNTAVSSTMEFFNQIKGEREKLRKSHKGIKILKETMEKLVLLLSPFAPHICEELWARMGNKTLLAYTSWPSFDSSLAKEERVTIVVQVNGKLRDKFEVERDLSEIQIKEKALGLNRIKNIRVGKKVKKIIYIKNKLVNIVI
ncbi:MAG: class I tRNA ligase family protein, partial [Candidatus Aminicenantes bacterium]|nr:class I tRNA ligase family protein [Candidatus Aminicenantes bacterium]